MRTFVLSFIILICVCWFLLNMRISFYFYKMMKENNFNKHQLKRFILISILSHIFIIGACLCDSFLLSNSQINLTLIATILFIGIISYYNYQITCINPFIPLWWHKISFFDKVLLVLFFILSVITFYQIRFLSSFLSCLTENVIFIYLLFIKQLKNKHKLQYVSSNKFINLIKNISSCFVYYLGWIFIFLYLISSPFILFIYDFNNNSDSCLDSGLCQEGLQLDYCEEENAPCSITKEFCLKHNYIWYEGSRYCYLKKSDNLK